MNDLSGRIALITGAGKGIGAGIARALAAAGARVAVNYGQDAAAATMVVDGIRNSGGEGQAVQADISVEADVRRMFTHVRATYGPVDLLVNNAGVWNFQPIVDVTVEEYRRHYDTNVLGTLLVSREFAMQDDVDGGSVVNLTSVGIGPTAPGTSLYTGTKMAVVGITKVLALEFAPRGIRVNAIAAGLIDTAGTRATGFMGSPAAEELVGSFPLGRVGQPDDIAKVAAFLAGSDAGYMTGQVLFVDGGQSLL